MCLSGSKNIHTVSKVCIVIVISNCCLPVIIPSLEKKPRLLNYRLLPCGLQHAAAGQSGCLVSIKGQSREDWSDCIVAGGRRAKRPELRLQILCRFHKCLIIVHVCLLAFIHVCGLVSLRWCHVNSCRFIFLYCQSGRAFDSCRLSHWHGGHSIRSIQ